MKQLVAALAFGFLLTACASPSSPVGEDTGDDDAVTFIQSALQQELQTEESIEVSLDQRSEEHIRGMFKVAGEQAGALFLAVWQEGEWDIVFAGNGAISCSDVEPYAFPAEMVADCN